MQAVWTLFVILHVEGTSPIASFAFLQNTFGSSKDELDRATWSNVAEAVSGTLDICNKFAIYFILMCTTTYFDFDATSKVFISTI